MSYRTTRQADQDIIDIYVRSAADFGVAQAERYHAGLVAVFDLLADNPHIARERAEFNPPVRLHPYQAHMIAYAVHGEGILIIRVPPRAAEMGTLSIMNIAYLMREIVERETPVQAGPV